jgi:hypothetical protein
MTMQRWLMGVLGIDAMADTLGVRIYSLQSTVERCTRKGNELASEMAGFCRKQVDVITDLAGAQDHMATCLMPLPETLLALGQAQEKLRELVHHNEAMTEEKLNSVQETLDRILTLLEPQAERLKKPKPVAAVPDWDDVQRRNLATFEEKTDG